MNEILKLLRIAYGYKPKDVAEKLGISQSMLSQIESGLKKPTNELLERYGKVFKIRVSTLMFFDEERRDKDLKYQELLLMMLERICNKKQRKGRGGTDGLI